MSPCIAQFTLSFCTFEGMSPYSRLPTGGQIRRSVRESSAAGMKDKYVIGGGDRDRHRFLSLASRATNYYIPKAPSFQRARSPTPLLVARTAD